MATHSRILAWKIPWTGEPGGLQSMGSQGWTRLSTHARVTVTHNVRSQSQGKTEELMQIKAGNRSTTTKCSI